MRARGIYAGAVLLTAGALLSACEDEEELEITGPALEEVITAAQSSADADGRIRIGAVSSRYIGGRDEPWVFIDGVRITTELGALGPAGHGDLDPRLIEKITVIKGTKAVELYGPDAWVGVILITTKDTILKREGSG